MKDKSAPSAEDLSDPAPQTGSRREVLEGIAGLAREGNCTETRRSDIFTGSPSFRANNKSGNIGRTAQDRNRSPLEATRASTETTTVWYPETPETSLAPRVRLLGNWKREMFTGDVNEESTTRAAMQPDVNAICSAGLVASSNDISPKPETVKITAAETSVEHVDTISALQVSDLASALASSEYMTNESMNGNDEAGLARLESVDTANTPQFAFVPYKSEEEVLADLERENSSEHEGFTILDLQQVLPGLKQRRPHVSPAMTDSSQQNPGDHDDDDDSSSGPDRDVWTPPSTPFEGEMPLIICPPEPIWPCGEDLRDLTPAELARSSDVFMQVAEELHFHWRVLKLGTEPVTPTPLLERLKFLCIVSSNLDEYFSKNMYDVSKTMRPLYERISAAVQEITAQQESCLTNVILPSLAKYDMRIVRYADLNVRQRTQMTQFFRARLFPLLTPLTLDPTHPFPLLRSYSLYLAVLLEGSQLMPSLERSTRDGDESPIASMSPPNASLDQSIASALPANMHVAWVRVPSSCSRFITVGNDKHFLPVEEIIIQNLNALFENVRVIAAYPFRVTRNTKLELDKIELNESEDFLKIVEENLYTRQRRAAVRLEVAREMPEVLTTLLREQLNLEPLAVYRSKAPIIGLNDCFMLANVNIPALRYPPWRFKTHSILAGYKYGVQSGHTGHMFELIRHNDLLFSFPIHSFDETTLRFLESAVRDPGVRLIKMVLYRCGNNSPVVKLLMEAARRGVDVNVLVELKASFDEDQNVLYARMLQEAGCNVAYGVKGYKTHAKLILVVREENGMLASYCNVATGNYNATTAKIYTDFSLFTSRDDVCADVTDLFNVFTGYSAKKEFRKLLVSPVNMRDRFLELIQREIENARSGYPARIICQCNGITEVLITQRLYEASMAGVRVDLIVRGICRIRPGITGISENIRVVSILGRFLLHARVFYFANARDGRPEYYIGSADWRSRNLHARLEAVCPVEDKYLQQTLWRHLNRLLSDSVNGWEMLPDGRYVKGDSEALGHLRDAVMAARREAEAEALKPSTQAPVTADDATPGSSETEHLPVVRKAGCVPVRLNRRHGTRRDDIGSRYEVLLITSTSSSFTGNNPDDPRASDASGGSVTWVFPKGSMAYGEDGRSAALREALEEAGVSGELGPLISVYQKRKRRTVVTTELYLLHVKQQMSLWGESGQRHRRWFTLDEAANLISKEYLLDALMKARQALGDTPAASPTSPTTMAAAVDSVAKAK
jgi:polyphosphate kinase